MAANPRTPEILAALVNALVVLALPSLVVGVVTIITLGDARYSGPVHPANWSPWPAAIRFIVASTVSMLPFALVAAWRTWVPATRWRAGDRTLQGVVEAGGCGLGTALLVLLPGIIRRPMEAPPYVIVYGGLGLIVGLVLGLLLLLTAGLVLAMTERRVAG